MKKRIIVILLAAVLVLCSVPFLSAENVESAVTYTPSAEGVAPGDTFEVTVSFRDIKNAIAYAVMPDDESLRAADVAFVSVSEIGENRATLFAPDPDDANDVAAAYLSTANLNGDYVKYTFKVSEDAVIGSELTLRFAASVLDESNRELSGAQTAGTVTVTVEAASNELLGDINLDGSVDIKDALRLFQHSMDANSYPIDYKGNVDFIKDGNVDIKDALRLFQYSMSHEAYPIG